MGQVGQVGHGAVGPALPFHLYRLCRSSTTSNFSIEKLKVVDDQDDLHSR